jgi:hypothetical protein
LFPGRGVGIAERPELVDLILEEIRIDGARLDAVLLSESGHGIDTGEPVLEIPQHVQREGRADPGDLVDVSGIRELFFNRAGGRGLKKLPETRAGIGEAP